MSSTSVAIKFDDILPDNIKQLLMNSVYLLEEEDKLRKELKRAKKDSKMKMSLLMKSYDDNCDENLKLKLIQLKKSYDDNCNEDDDDDEEEEEDDDDDDDEEDDEEEDDDNDEDEEEDEDDEDAEDDGKADTKESKSALGKRSNELKGRDDKSAKKVTVSKKQDDNDDVIEKLC